MGVVSAMRETPVSALADVSPVTVVGADRGAPVCLVCEHASDLIPASLGALGLADKDRHSHAVWDIGAEALARRMAEALDAPLVLAGVSRVVIDLNRPPERPDAMPVQAESIEIPGNADLSQVDRADRIAAIYEPFHQTVRDTLDGFAAPPTLVTIHSFTPVWYGKTRETEIGLLHDQDPSLAQDMMAAAPRDIRIELNQPYSAADGVTHMLAMHGTARGLRNVMLEVRNDLLLDDAGVARIADVLSGMLRPALGLHEVMP